MAPLLVLSPLSYQGLDCCPRPLGRAPLPWGGFLILSPVGILGWRMLSCDVRCEVFSSNPDLSPLDASSTPSPGGTIKNVSTSMSLVIFCLLLAGVGWRDGEKRHTTVIE